MTQNGTRDFGPEEWIDDGGTDDRVLAKNVEIVRRQIPFAIQPIVIEQAHAAVMHQGDNFGRVDFSRRQGEETCKCVDAGDHGIRVPAQLRKP